MSMGEIKSYGVRLRGDVEYHFVQNEYYSFNYTVVNGCLVLVSLFKMGTGYVGRFRLKNWGYV